jgi:hypothetical protein
MEERYTASIQRSLQPTWATTNGRTSRTTGRVESLLSRLRHYCHTVPIKRTINARSARLRNGSWTTASVLKNCSPALECIAKHRERWERPAAPTAWWFVQLHQRDRIRRDIYSCSSLVLEVGHYKRALLDSFCRAPKPFCGSHAPTQPNQWWFREVLWRTKNGGGRTDGSFPSSTAPIICTTLQVRTQTVLLTNRGRQRLKRNMGWKWQ